MLVNGMRSAAGSFANRKGCSKHFQGCGVSFPDNHATLSGLTTPCVHDLRTRPQRKLRHVDRTG